jgi:hypothetical protein
LVGNACALATQSLSLGSGPVAGVLEGPSRNRNVSCGVPTPGPDAFFSLTLDAYALVDLRVDAPVDTFIAVLAGCGTNVKPWSCGAPPVGDADGGLGKTTSLRVTLPADTYTVVVDTASADQPAAPFTLSASVAPPARNGACATPTSLDLPTPPLHESLILGGPPVAACGDTTVALYYFVVVPPGNRLEVAASAKAGDQDWTPRIAAFDACDATTCLARGSRAAGPAQVLDWINNGSASHTVLFSVSADGPVVAAEFDLAVGVTDLTNVDGGSD